MLQWWGQSRASGAGAPADGGRRTLADLLPTRLALVALGTILQTIAMVVSLVTGGPAQALPALVMVGCVAIAVCAFVVAGLNGRMAQRWLAALEWLGRGAGGVPALVGRATMIAALVLSVAAMAWLAGNLLLRSFADPGVYVSDAVGFNQFDAELVISGVNPYTADGRFWEAVGRFPAAEASPLREGRYASSTWGPSAEQLGRDVRAALADPAQRGPEWSAATLHSYPALAFLVDVPAVWLGLPSTMLISLLFVVALLALVGRALPPGYRAIGWVVLLSNAIAIELTLRGAFEAVALVLVMLAWQMLDRRWLSPVLFGAACAAKQVVWPLAPLYLVIIARRGGWGEVGRRLPLMAGGFIVPNLPWMVASPGAWSRSMLLPISLPLFPSGMGLIGLARGGIVPLWPEPVYSVLEIAAMIAVVGWCALRRLAPTPELALVLGLVPLALAWRSLDSYFAWLPALALYAAVPLLPHDTAWRHAVRLKPALWPTLKARGGHA